MKRLKIEMVRMNVKEKEGFFEKEIALTESYFFKCFEVFRDKKIEENELIDGVIKVILSKENGFNELNEGILYKGKKYYEIITTPSGMKHEESLDDVDYKSESIFISEEHKDFIEEFEESLSAGIIKEMEVNKTKVCTNKMFTSKKALAMTGADFIEGMPRICFVDEFEYTYNSNYSFLNDKNEIINGIRDINFVLNDGGGLMSPTYAAKIQKGLDKSYKIEFCIFRLYHGLAGKGVLVNFDFTTYIKSQYKVDTDTFKKENDKYYLKDYFGLWRDIDGIDCIMNKSQAKYLGSWKYKGVKKTKSLVRAKNVITKKVKINKVPKGKRWEEIIYPIYKDNKYNEVNKGLYISKVNKDPKKLKNRIKLNYQVLQNLNISAKDLIKVATETIEEFKNVISFNDVNYIKLALGDWLREDKEVVTITSKLDLVIDKFGEDTLEWDYTRETIKRQLIKRLNQLAGGKIPFEGEICIGAIDPVSYCNYLINKDRGTNGLEKGEFYQGGNVGARLSYRNPIAYYGEITEINLVNNELLQGYTPELLFVNTVDDFLFIKSGADVDGDLFGVVNNKILQNGIIKEEAPFVNLDDSKTEEFQFTREQAYEDLWSATGNLIGEIAIKNSRLCADITRYDCVVNKEGKVLRYSSAKKSWLQLKKMASDLGEFMKVNYYLRSEADFYFYNEDESIKSWEEYMDLVKEHFATYETKKDLEFKTYLEEKGYKKIKDFSEEEQKILREKLFKKI